MHSDIESQFQSTGLWQSPAPASPALIDTLGDEYAKITASATTLHYPHLSGVHNPWGRSAQRLDTWALLEICQSNEILEQVVPLIGPDIILWESAFYDTGGLVPEGGWLRHSRLSPIDPARGVVVNIAFAPDAGEQLAYLPGSHRDAAPAPRQSAAVKLERATITCLDLHLAHRYRQYPEKLLRGHYQIHYMPATCLFNRDPAAPAHRLAAQRLPLLNYTGSPIWLVHGEDHRENDFAAGFAPPVGQWTSARW